MTLCTVTFSRPPPPRAFRVSAAADVIAEHEMRRLRGTQTEPSSSCYAAPCPPPTRSSAHQPRLQLYVSSFSSVTRISANFELFPIICRNESNIK